jgi:WD40 repeat protein
VQADQTVYAFPGHGQQLRDGGAWSPDGKKLAFYWFNETEQPTLRRTWAWDAHSGELVDRLPGPEGHLPLAWSPDGRTLAVGNGDGTVGLWKADADQWDNTFKGHTGVPSVGAWSHDGAILATGGPDHTVRLWDVRAGKSLHTLPEHKGRVCALAWSPDDRTVLTGASEDTSFRLWDAVSGKVLTMFQAQQMGQLRCLAWSPDGQVAASWGDDGKVRLWEVATAACRESFDLAHPCLLLTWSADGKTLTALDNTGMVRRWDRKTGQVVGEFQGLPWAPTPAPDGRTLAAPAGAGVVFLWELDAGRRQGTLAVLGDKQTLAIGPAGNYRGSALVGKELVYVVQTDHGQETLSPAEFETKYGWKNDPKRVRLAGE